MADNTSIRWVAGLSNGETLIEGKGICIHDDNASSWARLQGHISKNNLTIQSFGIWAGDRHFNLPSVNTVRFDKFNITWVPEAEMSEQEKMENPNYTAKRGYNKKLKKPIPISYNCFRGEAHDIGVGDSGSHEEYICAEAIFEGYKLQVWVDCRDTNKSWTNLLKIGDEDGKKF